MILTMPDKNDKDAQIAFLKDVLVEVKKEISTLYESSRCEDCCDNFYSDFKEVDDKVNNIIDFIDKRLIDVTYWYEDFILWYRLCSQPL